MKLATLLIPLAFAASLPAQNLKEFEKHVTEFTLPNGLHFIVLERHEAPVVSFHTYVNAGSVDDPKGKTGLAHMFEHMAFKGTETIGTTNWPAEKEGARRTSNASTTSSKPNATRLARPIPTKIKTLEAAAPGRHRKGRLLRRSRTSIPRIIEENGGVGMNASTGEDSTNYFYNFPANRVELWFYLESARFLHPVFREFYKERDVVREERRMRVESDPQGKLMEQMLGHRHRSASLPQHARRLGQRHRKPARDGRREVLRQILRARQHHHGHRGRREPGAHPQRWPKNISAASRNARCRRPVITVEPPQEGPKRVEVASPAQPMEFIAYQRPDQYDKDDPVFDVISSLLSGGRTSIIYKDMVRDKKLALAAGAESRVSRRQISQPVLLLPDPGLGPHRRRKREGTRFPHRRISRRRKWMTPRSRA